MILCLCEGASDRDLRAEIENGCGSVRELVRRTGAGSHCGQCACDLKRLMAESRFPGGSSDDDDDDGLPAPFAAN